MPPPPRAGPGTLGKEGQQWQQVPVPQLSPLLMSLAKPAFAVWHLCCYFLSVSVHSLWSGFGTVRVLVVMFDSSQACSCQSTWSQVGERRALNPGEPQASSWIGLGSLDDSFRKKVCGSDLSPGDWQDPVSSPDAKLDDPSGASEEAPWVVRCFLGPILSSVQSWPNSCNS